MAEAQDNVNFEYVPSLEVLGQQILQEPLFKQVRRDLKKAIDDDLWEDEDLNKLILDKGFFEDYDDSDYGEDGESLKETVGKAAEQGILGWRKQKFLFLCVLRDESEGAGRQGEVDNFKREFNKPDESVTVRFIRQVGELMTALTEFFEAHEGEESLRVLMTGHGEGEFKKWGHLVSRSQADAGDHGAGDKGHRIFIPNEDVRGIVSKCIKDVKPNSTGNIDVHFYYCFAQVEENIPEHVKNDKSFNARFHRDGEYNPGCYVPPDPSKQQSYALTRMGRELDRDERARKDSEASLASAGRVNGDDDNLRGVQPTEPVDDDFEDTEEIRQLKLELKKEEERGRRLEEEREALLRETGENVVPNRAQANSSEPAFSAASASASTKTEVPSPGTSSSDTKVAARGCSSDAKVATSDGSNDTHVATKDTESADLRAMVAQLQDQVQTLQAELRQRDQQPNPKPKRKGFFKRLSCAR